MRAAHLTLTTLATTWLFLQGCTVEIRCFDAECDPNGNGGTAATGGAGAGGDAEGGSGGEGAGETCGDGLREGDELCDGTDFGQATCQALGLGPGQLTCTGSCTLYAGGCNSQCGNGMLDPGEVCDGDLLSDATCTSIIPCVAGRHAQLPHRLLGLRHDRV
jgi:hypothetical protein